MLNLKTFGNVESMCTVFCQKDGEPIFSLRVGVSFNLTLCSLIVTPHFHEALWQKPLDWRPHIEITGYVFGEAANGKRAYVPD